MLFVNLRQELETEVIDRKRWAVGKFIDADTVLQPCNRRYIVRLKHIQPVGEDRWLPCVPAELPKIFLRQLRPETRKDFERNA